MDDKLNVKNVLVKEGEEFDNVINEAVQLDAEVEVGAVAKIILGFWRNIPSFEFYTRYAQGKEPEQLMDTEQLMMDLLASIMATLTLNYKDKSVPAAKA